MWNGKQSLLLGILTGLLFSAGLATAQATISDILRESDENGDGKLQRDEAPIQLLPRFDEIDQDRDSSIDSFEAWEYSRRQREAAAKPRPSPSYRPLRHSPLRPPER